MCGMGEHPDLPPSLIAQLHQQTLSKIQDLKNVQDALSELLRDLTNIDWDKNIRIFDSWRKN